MTQRKAKRPTIKDVAREAGVSIAAVSFALNNSGSIGEDARARVLEVVEALGYRRNQSATTMRTGRSMTIGLLLPDLCNPFFPGLAHAIGEAARASGYAIVLVESNNGEQEADGLRRLVAHGVDGLCWCPSSRHDLVSDLGIEVPTVVIDRPLPKHDVVISDYCQGGSLLAEHLIEAGCRKIGLVSGPRELPGTGQRKGALLDALADRVHVSWATNNTYSIELNAATSRAISRGDVDAIACGNDMIAIGVIQALTNQGLRVPSDVMVVGFDDIPWATVVQPTLTTVRQPLEQIGSAAVELLLRRLYQPLASIRRVKMPVQLVHRGSSGVTGPTPE